MPEVRFPATLIENASYRVELTGPIEDIDGRGLANAADFPVSIETGRMPPGATFGTGLRVVAAREGAVAPLLLRRPPERMTGYRLRVPGDRDIARWLQRVREATWDWSRGRRVAESASRDRIGPCERTGYAEVRTEA